MLKPKKRAVSRQYWESLSDDELLNAQLVIDDPESLPNLVTEIPDGDEEPYVEYGYDHRGEEVEEPYVCVHGHHRHKSGFVVRKGESRFLVGRVCGEKIYGQKFAYLTSDFEAAIERRELLQRARATREAVEPFRVWLEQLPGTKVFEVYDRIQQQFRDRLPWLTKELKWHTNNGGCVIEGHKLPPTLFNGYQNPHREYLDITPVIMSEAMLLVGKISIHKDLKFTFGRLQAKLSRLELVIKHLTELIEFFQPRSLSYVCVWATKKDDRRRYEQGTLSISSRNDKGPVTVRLPQSYQAPSLEALQNFRAALAGIKVEK